MDSNQSTSCASETANFHFPVGRELTVHTLPDIHRGLMQQLNRCREVEVDFSAVRVVDNRGVRAILTIRRDALRKGKALHFVSRSAAFLQLLDAMNGTFLGPERVV